MDEEVVRLLNIGERESDMFHRFLSRDNASITRRNLSTWTYVRMGRASCDTA